MPTTTAEQRERRRAMALYLHALDFGPSQTARALGVSRQTVTADLHVIEEEWGDKLTAPQAAAQVRGLAHKLSSVLMDLLQDKDPVVRVMGVRTLWTIFRERVALEQLFGMMPKEAERVEVSLERETMDTIFQAFVNRVSADAQLEIVAALRSLDQDKTDFDKRPQEDSGGPAAGTGFRRRLDKRGFGP